MLTILYPDGPAVRPARPEDVDRIVAFEIEIARISFPDDPITDPAVHAHKLSRAMEKDPRGMFVMEAGDKVIGWLWITINANFLTGEHYATFRSFAVAETWRGSPAPRAFFEFGIDWCKKEGVRRLTGKVHVSNASMRALYKLSGFQPTHLTMEMNLE
jgi:GNAT superfamily N-acetyltransferase